MVLPITFVTPVAATEAMSSNELPPLGDSDESCRTVGGASIEIISGGGMDLVSCFGVMTGPGASVIVSSTVVERVGGLISSI
jgi:hypothetical protein